MQSEKKSKCSFAILHIWTVEIEINEMMVKREKKHSYKISWNKIEIKIKTNDANEIIKTHFLIQTFHSRQHGWKALKKIRRKCGCKQMDFVLFHINFEAKAKTRALSFYCCVFFIFPLFEYVSCCEVVANVYLFVFIYVYLIILNMSVILISTISFRKESYYKMLNRIITVAVFHTDI